MFSILKREPKPARNYVIRSEDGWFFTMDQRLHKAALFTDPQEAAAVCQALNGPRHKFHTWKVFEGPMDDPRKR